MAKKSAELIRNAEHRATGVWILISLALMCIVIPLCIFIYDAVLDPTTPILIKILVLRIRNFFGLGILNHDRRVEELIIQAKAMTAKKIEDERRRLTYGDVEALREMGESASAPTVSNPKIRKRNVQFNSLPTSRF